MRQLGRTPVRSDRNGTGGLAKLNLIRMLPKAFSVPRDRSIERHRRTRTEFASLHLSPPHSLLTDLTNQFDRPAASLAAFSTTVGTLRSDGNRADELMV